MKTEMLIIIQQKDCLGIRRRESISVSGQLGYTTIRFWIKLNPTSLSNKKYDK